MVNVWVRLKLYAGRGCAVDVGENQEVYYFDLKSLILPFFKEFDPAQKSFRLTELFGKLFPHIIIRRNLFHFTHFLFPI